MHPDDDNIEDGEERIRYWVDPKLKSKLLPEVIEIMETKGYSRGTANRIVSDRNMKARIARTMQAAGVTPEQLQMPSQKDAARKRREAAAGA
jgi:hypothetical protein